MKLSMLLLPLISTGMLLASNGASIYNTKCKSCHGADGTMKAMGKSAAIKGMKAEDVTAAMHAYANGEKEALAFVKAMKKDFITKHSEEEQQEVAKYISEL